MAIARGHLNLGRCSPRLVTHGIQLPKTKPTEYPLTRLTHSMYASQEKLVETHSRPEWHPMPSQHNEPPIPGLSPSSEPPEDVPTREREPEVAPMQSTEDPFVLPTTPRFRAPLIPIMTLARNLPTYDQL
ncbi:hypothetical protein O181_081406 [Austropuccinia psidii MF-1]|uniref:Uncharacterized protein n=1 Tax=Austropuccinia psidii MF-1 TaxID=1389203 RepID=A0A9Q3IFX5_9BASI|nr:hypothetical protein [Austropuccinia psidii MF-1]